jgi:ribonuclease R
LDDCQGKPAQTLIETLTIRAMAKAVYSTDNIGHYGLAFPYYTHFTSPIRRYPDMMVHRLVAKYLLQSKDKCRSDKEELEQACIHCSDCEMAAQAAERDSIKQMHAKWISNHIGEEFDAVISGVTEFGLFVQLTDTLTEGLVPIRTIERNDYMQFDEENYCLIAARSGKTYTLSDRVRVQVTKVDIERKLIDFVLVDTEK